MRILTFVAAMIVCAATAPLSSQAPANRAADFERLARAALAQHTGTLIVRGVREPVEVRRDRHGIPHIYAKNTHDLFFAQGFTVAQDRMWQLELWRRNGEGKLAEVLGPAYVTRDRFARLLAFRGNWDEEMRKYHPEGPIIFDAFAQGVNAAIQKALDEQKVPVEFRIMGFQPAPHWTAKTLLTRMPGWTLSRNVAGEVQRALDVKALGLEKTRELKPTDPETPFVVPPGLDLEDITPDILAITRGANDIRWDLTPAELRSAGLGTGGWGLGLPGAGDQGLGLAGGDYTAGFGSNNWVIGGKKSATGMPIIANDPHREVVNPALRYVVHLNAPGWNAIGATEPGLPGISIGHNERVAWGFTILGMDQQDLYVEETDPANPKRYRWKGAWEEMRVERELIWVKGRPQPEVVDLSFTRHGPVLHENTARQRAYALRWVGAEPGGAGYLGSLNVMQAKNLDEFKAALPKAWYLPSHSLVYADVDGNYAYFGVALTPQRRNWDGLMPVPGKDGQYEWDGFVPFEQLPFSRNDPRGFYNSSNNDVVPKIVPGYKIPLGYEYSAPYRYERAFEVLSQAKTFALADMERLQQDAMSLPARALVPLLRQVRGSTRPRPTTTQQAAAARSVSVSAELTQPADATVSADAQRAIDQLLAWNHVLDKTSTSATIFEYWFLRLQPLAYAPRVPEAQRASFRAYDPRRVIQWLTRPDAAYGASRREREAARNRILLEAIDQAVADLRKAHGEKWADVPWGQVHTARFTHPLANSPATRPLFQVPAVPKSGDAYTLLASSSATESGADQTSGASFAFVFDVKDWDNSTGLNAPGQSAQPLSPHYADLAPLWGEGTYVPLAFSRARVDAITASTLMLQPLTEHAAAASAPAPGLPAFEPLLPETFAAHGAQANAWGDYDGDGDLDLFVGFRGRLDRLYRNDRGTFTDVALAVGLGDHSETRAAAWGDYDGDGDLDLYVGFSVNQFTPNKLYRNDGARFVNVARAAGVEDFGTTRQPAWIDLDGDGDLDLFVAWRDRPNSLYRNDGGRFTDVAKELGLADPRKSVGAVWFDMDADGDLDLFVANQEGDANGLFRNDGGRFTDVADAAGVSGKGRSPVLGGVGPAVADYDLDGDLDLFVANYGPDELFRNDGQGRFTDVAPALGLAGDTHETTAAWGDVDNDGDPDLYLASFLTNVLSSRDKLYRNDRTAFVDVTPASVLKWDGSHGVQWVDVDGDGALDLSLADNHFLGRHPVHRNLGTPGARAVRVRVVDASGRATTAGAEVRAYRPGTRDLIASATVDAGSGYCSQSVQPVHLGIGALTAVDVEVTWPRGGRRLVAAAPATAGGDVTTVRVGQ